MRKTFVPASLLIKILLKIYAIIAFYKYYTIKYIAYAQANMNIKFIIFTLFSVLALI